MKPLYVLLMLALPTAVHAGDLKTFVSDYCMDCHDDATEKGGLSMEKLSTVITAANSKDWLRILEQAERHTMPPADELQPSAEDRLAAVLELEGRLVAYVRTLPERELAVLRRLNRTEYRNTIRDLMLLNVNSVDPTREFPDDNRVHGFSSNGEKLVTSSFLLRQYLEAAEQVVEQAIHFKPKPESRRWDLQPPFNRARSGFTGAERAFYQKVLKQPQPFQTLYERMSGMPKDYFHPIDELNAGMPESGWYRIRIRAEARFRYTELDPKDPALDLRAHKFPSQWDSAEPLRLSLSTATLEGIDPDNNEALEYASTHYQSGQRELATWDLPDDQPTWLECRVWLNRGEYPRLGFPNGPTDSNYRISNFFKANKERLLSKEQLALYETDRAGGGGDFNIYMWFESPRIRVSRIEVEGPLNDLWPPKSHRVIFGPEAYRSADAGAVLERFAARAWRRPAASGEVAPLVKLVRAAEQGGLSPEAAIQEGIKAVLCSPEFLYREEKNDVLTGYEIASRLSYFLWSSMPDETLLKLAISGELSQPAVLRQQAMRLLQDPRSGAFVDEFLNGWLALRKLGAMSPDVRKFPVYYDDDLEPAMRSETRLFFRQLLNTNGSIERFLDSDYAFINKELAQLYGIDPKLVAEAQGRPVEGLSREDVVPDADGDAPSLAFAQVKLPDARRGGLLGQASVLTLTANGVDTSPIIRGVWLLENILGAPPAPPPPNIPGLEPDIRGAKTIREQLQKHRESANCRTCHKQIDPPGFALEHFDAIGRWRGHYMADKVALPVDASGRFGATTFKDVSGLKTELLNRREQFARCLVEKLLLHALGRELDVADRPHIRKIVETAAKNGYRLRDLVMLCAESEIFRWK